MSQDHAYLMIVCLSIVRLRIAGNFQLCVSGFCVIGSLASLNFSLKIVRLRIAGVLEVCPRVLHS